MHNYSVGLGKNSEGEWKEKTKYCSVQGHEERDSSWVKVRPDPLLHQIWHVPTVHSSMNNNDQDENHLKPVSAIFLEFHIKKKYTAPRHRPLSINLFSTPIQRVEYFLVWQGQLWDDSSEKKERQTET